MSNQAEFLSSTAPAPEVAVDHSRECEYAIRAFEGQSSSPHDSAEHRSSRPVGPPFDIAPVAVSIEDAPRVTGLSRTRIFDAVRAKELTARKAGKSTIIEIDELKRWVQSMPTKGREVTPAASGSIAA